MMVRNMNVTKVENIWKAIVQVDKYIVTLRYTEAPDLTQIRGDAYRVIEGIGYQNP